MTTGKRTAGGNRRRRRLQTGGAIAAMAFGAAAVAGLAQGRAGAQPTSYTLTAAANEASFELDIANFPLLAPQAAYFSPGTAQSELDSFGGSTAFAGAPFLGQTIEGVGGLVSGLGSGVLPPLPQTLPGYISTTNPSDPSESASQGPYTLTSNSTQDSSTATAGIGLVSGQPQLLSTSATAATTLNPDGSLQATAQTTTQPLAVGSLLQLGTVQATAAMTVSANGTLTKTSSLDLGTLTIAGLKIGLTQSGFQLLNSLLPIPSTAALNNLLAPLGLQINFLPSTETNTSVTSAGLQITKKLTVPVEGATAIILTIGQATATLQYQTPPSTSSGVTTPATTPTTTAINTAVPTQTGTAPAAIVATPTPTTPTTTTTSSIAPLAPTRTPQIANTSPTTDRLPTITRANGQLGPDAIRWYGILALAALALTLASRLASALAIRPQRIR